jgi:hypothetical protein
LIKLAEGLVDIVNEYEGLGGMEAELLKNEFSGPVADRLGTVFKNITMNWPLLAQTKEIT